jgi:hypothetical protein
MMRIVEAILFCLTNIKISEIILIYEIKSGVYYVEP